MVLNREDHRQDAGSAAAGDGWPMWLGEVEAPLPDVKGLLQTFEDGGNWRMEPQEAPRKPPRGKPRAQQDLF